ncbi:MAG: hypothetical protein NC181_02155 [Clostridium sp.]|nr:hypothetical protein [Clostridium sp.]MCM1443687.1 hypothetical protein [Candidatus Amulumruptor caecigallinarius]
MPKGKIKQRNAHISDENIGINYLKIVIILIAILAIFYLIAYLVTKEKKVNETVESTIQYSKILVGNMLNLPDDEYYVLIEMENDKYNSLYETYLSTYSNKEKALKYYTIDMSDGFNKQYISNEANLDIDSISDIKFNSTTLLKIKSKKIVEKYTTKEEIIKVSEQMINKK